MIDFYKYHGTGNDFIMIDNRQEQFTGDKVKFAQKWCHRRFGIGSDGIIFIENGPDVDFVMDFYNPDGSQSFCGNGSRCSMAFAQLLGITDTTAKFKAIDGVHEAKIENGLFCIHMGDVNGLELIQEDQFIHTGSPHYISYCHNGDKRDIVEFGRKIRYNDRFKDQGTNVNLVTELASDHIDVRTYERGVENETYACGTGVTAAALGFAFNKNLNSGEIKVDVKGGKLKVKFLRNDKSFKDIWLIGPAEFVFKGSIPVKATADN